MLRIHTLKTLRGMSPKDEFFAIFSWIFFAAIFWQIRLDHFLWIDFR